jgi:S-adenosylmethionine-dependent methyltransferase
MHEPIVTDQNGTNFDGLSDRFTSHIYGTLKGRLRLDLLREDLASTHLASLRKSPVEVLDAGCGSALLSLDWAREGHRVTLVELSGKMLALARQHYAEAGLDGGNHASFQHGPLQQVLPNLPQRFQLILLHAVLEWTPNPQQLLQLVADKLAPGGVLSVTFYNLDGFLFRRLIQGNFKNLDAPRPRPHLGDLTPIYPLRGAEIENWLAAAGLQVVHKRGLRCFADFMHPQAARVTYEQILEQEKRYSLQEPFRSVARYMHMLAARP